MACASKHLFVLVLAHALAAFLDQRTHIGIETYRNIGRKIKSDTVIYAFRGRSIGRTAGFDPANRGSSPLPGTTATMFGGNV